MTRRRWIYPNDGSPPIELTADHAATPRGPLIYGDLPSYQSPITGEWIDGRVARREDLARHGCRPYEGIGQERQEAMRKQQYEFQRQDRAIEGAVVRSLGQISEASRRAILDN